MPQCGDWFGRCGPLVTGRVRIHVLRGRTRMIVIPLRRSVGFKAATASSSVETLPMLVRIRPSRTRWTISLSWARSDSTTKSTAKRPSGRASGGPTMDTSVPPARIRPADCLPMSPPMTSNTRSTSPTSSRASFSRSTNFCAPKSSRLTGASAPSADDVGAGLSRELRHDRPDGAGRRQKSN